MNTHNVWNDFIKEFKVFLRLEKSLSNNSIEAYLRDIGKLKEYCELMDINIFPQVLSYKHISQFVIYINDIGVAATSQARIISGIRAFYKYLLIEDIIDVDPTEQIDLPRLQRKLPDVLSNLEIESLISSIDLSKPNANRNKAIIEVLYGCGLRVSELCNLKISTVFIDDEFIKVKGKGSKERLVPIGKPALESLKIYLHNDRTHQKNLPKFEDFIFLNNRGKNLSRVMVFYIIKDAVSNAKIAKKISPHTLRHSFASHLVDGGANLRAVQQMLGHESITTTEIYTHVDSAYLHQAIIDFHPRGKL